METTAMQTLMPFWRRSDSHSNESKCMRTTKGRERVDVNSSQGSGGKDAWVGSLDIGQGRLWTINPWKRTVEPDEKELGFELKPNPCQAIEPLGGARALQS